MERQKNKSYLSQGRAYPQNIELEAVYGFSLRPGESPVRFANLPDNRAFNLSIHYSIAQLPQNNGYVPRLADERVGYFLTAYKNLRPPFEQIPVEKQRKALTILAKYVFSDEYLVFPPQLLNQLAPSRWNHWEDDRPRGSLDYPIHEIIVVRQFRILRSLLSGDRLSLLRNNELKTDDPKSILTMPELYETLKQNIWSEVVQEGGQNISTLRRSLQRIYVKMLVAMVLDDYTVPEDAQTLAWYQLRELKDAIGGVLRHHGRGLDIYTKAHLEETRDRITKTLDARYERVF